MKISYLNLKVDIPYVMFSFFSLYTKVIANIPEARLNKSFL